MRLALLTADQNRHLYFLRALENAGHEVFAYLENKGDVYNENNIRHLYLVEKHKQQLKNAIDLVLLHEDILNFKSKITLLSRGDLKSPSMLNMIQDIMPDLIITYGCGIISKELIQKFPNRIIGSHQGLPQYFRGSGSNFFAFSSGEACRIGVSLHVLNEGIDTGPILKQVAPTPESTDDYYSHSAKLILKTFEMYLHAISTFEKTRNLKGVHMTESGKLFQRKDFNDNALKEFFELLSRKSFSQWFMDSKNMHEIKLMGSLL